MEPQPCFFTLWVTKLIASVLRAAKEYEELRWVKRDDEDGGGVASSHKEVGTVVNKFFTHLKWFKSRVSTEERWGSWERMMNMDTSEMGKEEAEVVQRCYMPEYEENKERSEKEGWWEDIIRGPPKNEPTFMIAILVNWLGSVHGVF